MIRLEKPLLLLQFMFPTHFVGKRVENIAEEKGVESLKPYKQHVVKLETGLLCPCYLMVACKVWIRYTKPTSSYVGQETIERVNEFLNRWELLVLCCCLLFLVTWTCLWQVMCSEPEINQMLSHFPFFRNLTLQKLLFCKSCDKIIKKAVLM